MGYSYQIEGLICVPSQIQTLVLVKLLLLEFGTADLALQPPQQLLILLRIVSEIGSIMQQNLYSLCVQQPILCHLKKMYAINKVDLFSTFFCIKRRIILLIFLLVRGKFLTLHFDVIMQEKQIHHFYRWLSSSCLTQNAPTPRPHPIV